MPRVPSLSKHHYGMKERRGRVGRSDQQGAAGLREHAFEAIRWKTVQFFGSAHDCQVAVAGVEYQAL